LKDSLDKAIEELEIWQKMFDPSWFLILKISDPLIDAQLAGKDAESPSLSLAHHFRDSLKDDPQIKVNIFLPNDDGLASAQRCHIPLSTALMAQRPGSRTAVILDSVGCDRDSDISTMTKDVRTLARKLRHADPLTFGLLQCFGVVRVVDRATRKPVAFDFVFRIPKGMDEPRSLRSQLVAHNLDHSLSDRFRMAKQLANSVSFLHAYGFVHKNIWPEAILTFKDNVSALGSSFLVGLKTFRMADGKTLRVGDSTWQNLYQHPRRQGLQPDEDYTMQHDIYSLGVCLLEIGIWESFVCYDNHGHPSLSRLLDESPHTLHFSRPVSVKDRLTTLAREVLPRKMGDRYARIVTTCLTCLDDDNADFGDVGEFHDEDGVLVGVRYIEKVMTPLVEGVASDQTQVLLQLDGISV